MSWIEHHTIAERLSMQAAAVSRSGAADTARELYRQAATHEEAALAALSELKQRTLGITAVSAVALWYKAHEFESAETVACRFLMRPNAPAFATSQLRELLGLIWTTRAAAEAGVSFAEGDVLVSVKGGEVVYGGAPLDLILSKVGIIQAMLFRTIEMMMKEPFRRRGLPTPELMSMFRPWLFHAPAGSYQFAVRMQSPPQMRLWDDRPEVFQVTEKFFDVLRASTSSEEDLAKVVADRDYRAAFVTLSRNLAPTGKNFDQLEVRDAGRPAEPVATLGPDTRQQLNATLRQWTLPEGAADRTVRLTGVLRAVHLDLDWLEMAPDRVDRPDGLMHIQRDRQNTRFFEAGDVLDDVVGPMVNRRVAITAILRDGRYLYRDIELLDE